MTGLLKEIPQKINLITLNYKKETKLLSFKKMSEKDFEGCESLMKFIKYGDEYTMDNEFATEFMQDCLAIDEIKKYNPLQIEIAAAFKKDFRRYRYFIRRNMQAFPLLVLAISVSHK